MRSAPDGYVWIKSVRDAQLIIETKEHDREWFSDRAYELEGNGYFVLAKRLGRGVANSIIELIDIYHDAGDYTSGDSDYIRLLNWLKETGRNYPIRIHS